MNGIDIGIDLGTTFSCVAYINDDGIPTVISNSDNDLSTPSVVWFDGKNAHVGKKANLRKMIAPLHIHEFIKRDMGKPVEHKPDLYSEDDVEVSIPAPYEINGFKYGAEGMSAIILRKLKKEAVRFFKKIRKIEESMDERDVDIGAVITVPAYFGDKERQKTWLAGHVAGLNVKGIINEPTAAALTYGLSQKENTRIMVFDLGGGTFDVTILEMNRGEAIVKASDGVHTLGGKDWDEVIQRHIYEEFYKKNKKEIPPDKGFDIQQNALEAKFALSESEETTISLSMEQGDLDIRLYCTAPKSELTENDFDMDIERAFYFNERSSDLLSLCRTICKRIVDKAGLTWGDIDEILLAGGSCRMPMIPEMLSELAGRNIRRHVKGFSYDTAIAMGAALYGKQKGCVKDVVSHSIGVKYVHEGRHLIDHIILKNTHLPLRAERRYIGGPNTVLDVYEGESEHPDECIRRGHIPLYDIDGHVTITMEVDVNGIIKVFANPPGVKLVIKGDEIDDQRTKELRERVQAVVINL